MYVRIELVVFFRAAVLPSKCASPVSGCSPAEVELAPAMKAYDPNVAYLRLYLMLEYYRLQLTGKIKGKKPARIKKPIADSLQYIGNL